MRNAQSFIRRSKAIASPAQILIICEDTVSSLIYLKSACQFFRATAKIEVVHCGRTDPSGIIKTAKARSKSFNSVFCVIDRDKHPKFQEALQNADASKNVRAIVSYPSFEYWLLLHFFYTRAPYHAAGKTSAGDQVLKELTAIKSMSDYEKGDAAKLFDKLCSSLDTAILNAERSTKDACSCGEPNPSTVLHRLLREIFLAGDVTNFRASPDGSVPKKIAHQFDLLPFD